MTPVYVYSERYVPSICPVDPSPCVWTEVDNAVVVASLARVLQRATDRDRGDVTDEELVAFSAAQRTFNLP